MENVDCTLLAAQISSWWQVPNWLSKLKY